VHYRQYLATLTHQPEPLGPCDKGGCGDVHRWAPESLVLREIEATADEPPDAGAFAAALAVGKGASASAAATFVPFAAAGRAGLSLAAGVFALSAVTGAVLAATGGRE
jgi:hypothetical protein